METGVDTGVDEGGTVVGTAVVELDGGAGADPEPMAVVMGPFSMKTPDTYQSSGVGVLTMRRTPTWKSSELVEVDATMLLATLVRAAEPFEAQRPTVPAENWAAVSHVSETMCISRLNVRRCHMRSCTTVLPRRECST